MSTPASYRIWKMLCPFRKTGSPVLGTFGKSAATVIILRVEVFRQLIDDHPSLATAQFEVGEFTDEENS